MTAELPAVAPFRHAERGGHRVTASTYARNGWKLVVETDQIEVTSNLPQLDPNWHYTDAAGHEHYREGHRYPTLLWQWDDEDWTDDPEEAEGHWECVQCQEVILPGMTGPSMFREFISGSTYVHIELPDGQQLPVTLEEWAAIRVAGPNAESFVQAIVNREANRG